MKETNRLKILQNVIVHNLAEIFGITPQHCSRLLQRYRQFEVPGHGSHDKYSKSWQKRLKAYHL